MILILGSVIDSTTGVCFFKFHTNNALLYIYMCIVMARLDVEPKERLKCSSVRNRYVSKALRIQI